MSEWSNNNLAHRYTWYITKRLGIHKRSFNKSKDLKLRQFEYYIATASNAEQKQRAKTFALILTNLIEDIGDAKLDKNQTQTKAVSVLVRILLDGNNTLMHLAHAIDNLYIFKGE